MVTCGSDRVVWRFHERLCRGRSAAGVAVDGRELAELAARVERLKAVDEAFAHVKLSASIVCDEHAVAAGCTGGGSVATDV